jgi:hypothetical protein
MDVKTAAMGFGICDNSTIKPHLLRGWFNLDWQACAVKSLCCKFQYKDFSQKDAPLVSDKGGLQVLKGCRQNISTHRQFSRNNYLLILFFNILSIKNAPFVRGYKGGI